MKFSTYIEQFGNNTVGNENVDERQIDMLYDKAHLAVEIVRLYDMTLPKKLLTNISTIATLPSGAYGLYNSSENQKVISQQVQQQLRYKFGEDYLSKHTYHNIPKVILKRYIPQIDEKQIQPSDVIHVNVARIVRELGKTFKAVLEIASTIVHECTHEIEREETGKTSEISAKAAENKFMQWVKVNMPMIRQKVVGLPN